MTSKFDQVRPGDEFEVRADTWNAMVAAAQAHAARPIGAGVDPLRDISRLARTVRIKNDTGADVPRWGAMSYESPLFTASDNADEFINRSTLVGSASPMASGAMVVALEPIADGELGRAAIGGLVACQIDVADENDRFARMADGMALLTSDWAGPARIIWKESGTGVQYALLDLVGAWPSELPVLVTASLGLNGSGDTTTRWAYTIAEATPDASGGMTATVGGMTLPTAYNDAEVGNPVRPSSGLATAGNGAEIGVDDTGSGTVTISLRPVPTGVGGHFARVGVTETGVPVPWLSAPNALKVDVAC